MGENNASSLQFLTLIPKFDNVVLRNVVKKVPLERGFVLVNGAKYQNLWELSLRIVKDDVLNVVNKKSSSNTTLLSRRTQNTKTIGNFIFQSFKLQFFEFFFKRHEVGAELSKSRPQSWRARLNKND